MAYEIHALQNHVAEGTHLRGGQNHQDVDTTINFRKALRDIISKVIRKRLELG
jgi:hypothetical protein